MSRKRQNTAVMSVGTFYSHEIPDVKAEVIKITQLLWVFLQTIMSPVYKSEQTLETEQQGAFPPSLLSRGQESFLWLRHYVV